MCANEWRCILISFIRSSWLKTRGSFLFPKSPQTEMLWILNRARSLCPCLRRSMLSWVPRAWRTGTMRRGCGEMDECQRNTMWTEAWFLLQFVFCCLPRLSRSIHPSRRGEKNGCNLFLTPFLNSSLRHLHTFDRTLISDVKKARKRQTNRWFAVLAELKVQMIHVCHFTWSVLR